MPATSLQLAFLRAPAADLWLQSVAAPQCSLHPDTLNCRLARTLTTLHWVAALLAMLLVVVLALAAWAAHRALTKDLLPR